MIVFELVDAVGEGERHIDLRLVFRLVGAIAHGALPLPELHARHGILTGELLHVVHDAVLIEKLRCLKAAAHFVSEEEMNALVYNGLPLDRVEIVFDGDVDVREHGEIGLPADLRAGFALVRLLVQAADVLSLFKMQCVARIAGADIHIHVFRRILRGAQAQAVEAERILVAAVRIVVILAARIHLAEDKFPVIALLPVVVIYRDAAAVVLYLHGEIGIPRHGDLPAVTFTGLVDGVGQNLEHGMLTTLNAVRSEDNGRTKADTVRPLEHRNAVIVVYRFFHRHKVLFSLTAMVLRPPP